ncbi:MAG: hypothetical protein M5U01_11050 [Ardenticatenaceae bacterium]|nr:hypothetical protein [Ardenticatenaceae bacterium]
MNPPLEVNDLRGGPKSPLALIKPLRKQLGMIEMKRLTIALDEAYTTVIPESRLGRRGWLGYLYELFNHSDGQRSLGQIARVLGHEIGPIEVDVLARMVRDLERMGFMTVIDAREDGT